MALVASGAIAFSDVNVELGYSSTATIALNDAAVRTLFGIASGAIAMSDGYSKAATLGYVEEMFATTLFTGGGGGRYFTTGIPGLENGAMIWTASRVTAGNKRIYDTTQASDGGSFLLISPSLATNSDTTENSGGSVFIYKNDSTGTVQQGSSEYNAPWVWWTFKKKQKFFDIVTWSGNGTGDRTISHNLGSTPGMIILKDRSPNSWFVYHRGFSSPDTEYAILNASYSVQTGGSLNWNVTSTTFQADYNLSANLSGSTYVAYLFAHNAGGYGLTGTDNVITCGSYIADGSGNATISLGYEPQWIMVKRAGGTSAWFIQDTMRGLPVIDSGNGRAIRANTTDQEEGLGQYNLSSTGFIASNQAGGDRYIYMAIRRPQKVPTSATSVFSPVYRTGTGSDATVTTDFAPDLTISTGLNGNFTVWIDRVRGTSRVHASQITNPESYLSSSGNQVTLFGSNGITYGSSGNYTNTNGTEYINWIFRRAPKFFDIASYRGVSSGFPGTPQDVSHNLGAVPELIIIRNRTDDDNWFVYHSGTALPNAQFLNLYVAAEDNSTRMNTAPTSTTFNVGRDAMVNKNGSSYVAWLFATLPGISKVGSYTGTAAIQQINCGFTSGARFVMIKRTDSGANSSQENGQWYCFDTARGIVTGNDPYISMNRAQANQTGTDYIDPYSAGFEIPALPNSPNNGYPVNISGATYIFLAIA